MSDDLSPILSRWPYDPENLLVRVIAGDDGRQKVQLRIDLGILQMEMDGRPDGLRPQGFDSWLDYYEHQQRTYEANNPESPPYLIGEEDCLLLWREAVQYYHRYLGFWHLDLYQHCARDTARNLRLFAFVRDHAGDDRHKLQFDQWRPYVIMVHTRAVATPLLKEKKFSEALQHIEAGIDAVRDFLEEYQQTHRADECAELVSLERWREEILTEERAAAEAQPQSAAQVLRKRLDEAIHSEEFEEAARLRDEIRRLDLGP